MKGVLIATVLTVFLSGCVSQERAAFLNNTPGVELGHKDGYEYLKGYSVTFPSQGKYELDSLKSCVIKNITNNEVQLSDGSRSFTGAYTGNYYNITSKSQINGSEVIKTDTSSGLIFAGNGSYLTDGVLAVKRVVRFVGEIKQKDGKTLFEFANIQQAQTDSGAIPNSGFYDVASFSAASPDKVIGVLRESASNINSCLQKS